VDEALKRAFRFYLLAFCFALSPFTFSLSASTYQPFVTFRTWALGYQPKIVILKRYGSF